MRFRVALLVLSVAAVAAAFPSIQPAPVEADPGQATSPRPSASTRDPQALTLLAQDLSHLKPSPAPISDISLTATVAYTAGSDHETGSATLQALVGSIGTTGTPSGMSRVVLNLDNGAREEIRNGVAGMWSGADGQPHPMALHNCWTDAAWFYPLLAIQAASADPAVSVALGDNDSHSRASGNPATEVVLSRVLPHQSPAVAAEIQKLSAVHLYLDASTFLPVELDFNIHPDKDANRDIPVEIEFSDYRNVGGALVPYHIQKFIQHSLLLDLHVTAAHVNAGLSAAEFALPAASGGQK